MEQPSAIPTKTRTLAHHTSRSTLHGSRLRYGRASRHLGRWAGGRLRRMARRHALILSMILLVGCGVAEPGPLATPAPTQTPVPKRPEDAANAFFSAWQQSQYSAKYNQLSAEAQAETPRDVFLRRYTNIRDGTSELKLPVQASGPPD